MESNLVSQHNNLINAKYKLSLNEKKLILCAISKINPKETVTSELTIRLELKEMFDVFNCNKDNHTYFIELAKGLRKKDFPIKKLEDGTMINVGWINKAKLYKKGVLELTMDKDIVPYLTHLQEYTKYKLNNVIDFKSTYAFRIYELCKQYQSLKKRKITINELKEILGVENKYKKFPEFKKFILDVAKKEINDHSDINIEYELSKEGRSYKYIIFSILSDEQINEVKEDIKPEIKEIDPITQANIQTLKSLFNISDLSDKDILSILEAAQRDMAKIISKYYLIKDKKDIKNFTGLLIDAIREDYSEIAVAQETNKSEIKTKFHNLGGERFRKYSPEDFEQIALEKNKKKFGI